MTNTETKCTTCGNHVAAPYRRLVGGKVVEGCVDESHTGHLYGTSLEWHTSEPARQIRATTAARLTELLGEPMRGFGLPGKLDRSNRRGNANRPVRLRS